MFYSKREGNSIVSCDIRPIINQCYSRHINVQANPRELQDGFKGNVLTLIDNINAQYLAFERDYLARVKDISRMDMNICGHELNQILDGLWQYLEDEVRQGYLTSFTVNALWDTTLDVFEQTRCDKYIDFYYRILTAFLSLRRKGIKMT